MRADLTVAMKSPRDKLRTATLRMLLAAIQTEKVSGQAGPQTDRPRGLEGARQARKRGEAAQIYVTNGRGELAANERRRAAVIEEYLPSPLSEDEIANVVDTRDCAGGRGDRRTTAHEAHGSGDEGRHGHRGRQGRRRPAVGGGPGRGCEVDRSRQDRPINRVTPWSRPAVYPPSGDGLARDERRVSRAGTSPPTHLLGRPSRRSLCSSTTCARTSRHAGKVQNTLRSMGVSMKPGQMQLARPLAAVVDRQVLGEGGYDPALGRVVGTTTGGALRPSTLATVTIAPRSPSQGSCFRASAPRRAATWKVPVRLMPMTRSHSPRSTEMGRTAPLTPAEVTTVDAAVPGHDGIDPGSRRRPRR